MNIREFWQRWHISLSTWLRDYVNGELKSTLSSSGGINNNRMFVIGYNWDGMSNASISQTLLYNKTLTQQEILQNYNATKGRFVNALPPVRNGLVLELDAANTASYSGAGNTWYDLSGNNLNGTLTNGPTYLGIGSTSSLVIFDLFLNQLTPISHWKSSEVKGVFFSEFVVQ